MWLKPDLVDNGMVGQVLDRLAKEGFQVVRKERFHLTQKQV